MEAIVLFLYIFWGIRTIYRTLLFTHLWQLKEYRLDRMMDLLSTRAGRGNYFNLFTGLQLLLLFFLWIFRNNEEFFFYVVMGVAVVYLAESLQAVTSVFMRKLRRPKMTTKALLVMFITLVLEVGLVSVFIQFQFLDPSLFRLSLVLLVFSLILSDLNTLAVALFHPVTLRMKKKQCLKAHEKMRSLDNLKVIGITGSYGKSTTKEFLNTILSQKYNVLATAGNVNTEIGVAQTVLNKLKKEHEVFIVEMGAYKKGEIRAICEIVHPQVGILTGINEQHVGLFGSLERTMEAKFELMQSLPSHGLALFNGDNEYCLSLADGVQTPKKLYSIEDEADIYATDISVFPESVRCTIHYGDEKREVEMGIIGKQNILNVLACFGAALEVGMSFDEVCTAVTRISMPKNTMNVITKGDITVIDDTYNTNPDGLKSALRYIDEAYRDHTKIVIFPGIIELGESAEEIHTMLGSEIGQHMHYFVISRNDFSAPLVQGARLGGMQSEQFSVQEDPEEVMKLLDGMSGKKVILFESRGMEKVLRKLLDS